MNTGQRMKLQRKAEGLSAEEVAMALGVSAATIYRYERGDIEKVPGNLLEPLAKALHCSPAYLMGWEEVKKNNDVLSDIIIRAQRNEKFFDLMKSLYCIADDRLDMAKAVIDALNK